MRYIQLLSAQNYSVHRYTNIPVDRMYIRILSLFQTYGFEHILTLNNLEKLGLLKPQSQKTYSTVRKTLQLVVGDVNEQVSTKIKTSFFNCDVGGSTVDSKEKRPAAFPIYSHSYAKRRTLFSISYPYP